MNSPSHLRFAITIKAVLVFALLARSLSGQDFYSVKKTQGFLQSAGTGPVADPSRPFSSRVSAAKAGITLAFPGGGTLAIPFSPSDEEYVIERTFPTKAALDAAYPNGVYRMTGAGLPTLTFNLTTDAYPSVTPQVTGGTWNSGGLLVLDPTQANTINLSTFTGYATSSGVGHMYVRFRSLWGAGNVDRDEDITSVALFGGAATANPITAITIPARTMNNGSYYEIEVLFENVPSLDLTSVPGGGVATVFSKSLQCYVVAQTPGTTTPAAPTITAQPVAQSGTLGGSVTFTLGIRAGNTVSTTAWAFNGVPFRTNNSTKYRENFTPGAGGTLTGTLTILNLTAADVGTYSLQVFTGGGFVFSNGVTLDLASSRPAFTRQPIAHTIAPNSTVVFSAAATGSPTFQWQRNGLNVAGATNATLVIDQAAAAQAGTYTVIATNASGPITSNAATLTVLPAAPNPGRLINLSILTALSARELMTMGTVVGGAGTTGTKPLLCRAGGPSLAPFGITAFLPDPAMTLNRTSITPATTVATNNDWAGTAALNDAFVAVGAFGYTAPTSRDAAIFQPALAPGNYTVEVRDNGTGAGTVIAEIYDSTPNGSYANDTPRLVNVSVLKQIPTGGMLTVGFVVGGNTSKTVLIRAIGPTLGLAPFNIGGVMSDPQLTLFGSSQDVLAVNNDWGGDPQVSTTGTRVGAFATSNPGSKDAMLLVTLAPGSYSAQVSPVANTTGGTAIVEMYEVP